jgi:2-polyprenyl-3-methyl-5-hydroxy-6-metoxy-1,4-benzoquinol methylase
MKEIFDTYIENIFGDGGQAIFKLQQFANNYRQLFPLTSDAVLLDIGIGRGEMLSCMKKWGYTNFCGVDISPSTVSFCSSLGLPCKQVEDTSSWLRGNEKTFDLITLLDVLEHIKKEEIVPFLKALKGSLKPGGMLIVQVPNMQAPDSQLHRYNDFTHEVGFIENSLRQTLQVSGFSNCSIYGFEDSVSLKIREKVRLILRQLFWSYVRLLRKINGNLSPEILYPVFYAVAIKENDDNS